MWRSTSSGFAGEAARGEDHGVAFILPLAPVQHTGYVSGRRLQQRLKRGVRDYLAPCGLNAIYECRDRSLGVEAGAES